MALVMAGRAEGRPSSLQETSGSPFLVSGVCGTRQKVEATFWSSRHTLGKSVQLLRIPNCGRTEDEMAKNRGRNAIHGDTLIWKKQRNPTRG